MRVRFNTYTNASFTIQRSLSSAWEFAGKESKQLVSSIRFLQSPGLWSIMGEHIYRRLHFISMIPLICSRILDFIFFMFFSCFVYFTSQCSHRLIFMFCVFCILPLSKVGKIGRNTPCPIILHIVLAHFCIYYACILHILSIYGVKSLRALSTSSWPSSPSW